MTRRTLLSGLSTLHDSCHWGERDWGKTDGSFHALQIPIMLDGTNHRLVSAGTGGICDRRRIWASALRDSHQYLKFWPSRYALSCRSQQKKKGKKKEKSTFVPYLRMDGDLGLDPRRAARAGLWVEIRLDYFWFPEDFRSLPNASQDLF